MPENVSMDHLQAAQEYFDGRYVLQADCVDRQKVNDKRFANDDKRIDIIAHDFGIIKRLMWAVATSSIGALVVAVFELILR